jgi:hypothetical protein
MQPLRGAPDAAFMNMSSIANIASMHAIQYFELRQIRFSTVFGHLRSPNFATFDKFM